MGFWNDLFHPGRAYKKQQEERQKYYDIGQKQLQPYSDVGQVGIDKYKELLEALKDPSALFDKFNANYTESAHAKDLERDAMNRGQMAASSQGLNGSSAALQSIQNTTSNIANADRDAYIKQMMDTYLKSIGISSDLLHTGSGAAEQGANMSQNFGDKSGQDIYNQHTAGPDASQSAFKFALEQAMKYFTGGYGQGDYGRGAWNNTQQNPYNQNPATGR